MQQSGTAATQYIVCFVIFDIKSTESFITVLNREKSNDLNKMD